MWRLVTPARLVKQQSLAYFLHYGQSSHEESDHIKGTDLQCKTFHIYWGGPAIKTSAIQMSMAGELNHGFQSHSVILF